MRTTARFVEDFDTNEAINRGAKEIHGYQSIRSVKKDTIPAIERINEYPELFLHWVDLILEGVYGCDIWSYFRHQIYPNKRMNRAAWLFNLTVSIEFKLGDRHARQVWHGLSKEVQKKIDKGIKVFLDGFEERLEGLE